MSVSVKSRKVSAEYELFEWTLKQTETGFQVVALSYGCTILSIQASDRDGKREEVTLNYRDYQGLKSKDNPYYGCIAGRVANRIAKGKFSLNNKEYELAVNNGVNALHGGIEGFDKKFFTSEEIENGVRFQYVSKDGEEGYPGDLEVNVMYVIKERNTLEITYKAKLLGGAGPSTPINLTNHTYFNLSGNCSRKVTAGHSLQLFCDQMTPVDETQIPTGEMIDVAGTEFDYSGPTPLGARVPLTDGGGKAGIDHNFIVNGHMGQRHSNFLSGRPILPVAELREEHSGRVLRVMSSQPGLQVYTANWLAEDEEKSPHTQHNAVCLESQHFPDSINQSVFPRAVLSPGEVYEQCTLWEFGTADV